MCEHGNTRPVYVKIPADLSCTSEERWKHAQIDSCIADIVEALQQGDIDMRGSCCGHGKRFGNIQLQDGRVLLILTRGTLYLWKNCHKCLATVRKMHKDGWYPDGITGEDYKDYVWEHGEVLGDDQD